MNSNENGCFGAMRNGLKSRGTFSSVFSLPGAFILKESILTPIAHPIFIMETEAFRRQVFGEDYQGDIHSDRSPETLVKTLSAAGAAFPAIYMACCSILRDCVPRGRQTGSGHLP